jgi:Domain of unknown function DUF29
MLEKIANSSTALLYETDFAEWIETTAHLLRAKRFGELDVEHLIEEIESLGKRDKRELRSRLIKLLSHLLKRADQPEKRSISWRSTIKEQRRQILLILQDSPSLKGFFQEILEDCYIEARTEAAEETGLAIAAFPEQCPFSETDILTQDWLP